MPCRYGFRMCFSHLIYTVQPCLIHTCHTMPMPCSDHAVLLKATAQHGRLETAMLFCGLEKNGMVGAWHGHGMASVNQTRPHCGNQMGKTHSKPLAARHGRVTAWARLWNGMLCVNRALLDHELCGCATSWSLFQRSPTGCGASLYVIQKPHEWGSHNPRWYTTSKMKKRTR